MEEDPRIFLSQSPKSNIAQSVSTSSSENKKLEALQMCKLENHGSESVRSGNRLPKTVVPSRYDLTLRPNLVKFDFTGEEVVDIDVLEPTSTIQVNAKELNISEAKVVDANGTTLNGTIELCEETEVATITFDGVIGAGKWSFITKFTGILNDQLKGFYRSFWEDEAGKKHTIATTQFEATDARRAFPCWDEPEFKATFKVTLVVDENLTALSNGRILSTEVVDGSKYAHGDSKAESKKVKVVKFAETMKMSTYLVAFVVGEFVSSEPVNVNGKEVRIWCVPGKEHLTKFALDAAAFATDWYENYFGIPYPGGDKIDHIAIPDFAAGAMENLGCITYRETALLVDEKTAPHAAKVRVAVVVLHELAHMWFGDLVTMRWWNGLWLNESFATFMENLCLHHWKPEWNVWEEFALHRAAASRVDALKSTHPIECAVENPEQVDELFDVISYEKGCSVLYQLHQFIGDEIFRKGISAYLKKHSYANTETHDLWDALEEASTASGLNVPVRDIMDAWVFTPGHPVIEVSEGDSAGTIVLSQSPFKFIGDGEHSTIWPVPVILRVSRHEGHEELKRIVLSRAQETVYVGEKFDHVVVNAGGSGFYRVVYSPGLNKRLTDEVSTSLSVVERFNLINDGWSTVKAGIMSVDEYLEVIKLFGEETDPNVWSIIAGSLGHLNTLLGEDEKPAFRTVVRGLVSPAVSRLGWEKEDGENVQTSELRAKLIGVLGGIGEDEDVRAKAVEYFEKWLADKESVEPNLAAALVGVLAKFGDKKRYEEFKTLSKEAKNPQDTLRFLYALAGFRDGALLKKTIKMCLSKEVRSQDAPFLFASLLGNPEAQAEAWAYLKDNFDKMVKAFPQSGVVRMCGAAHSLDTPDLADDVREFFGKTRVKAGDMAIAQMLEQLEINVRMRKDQTAKLVEHLAIKSGDQDKVTV